MPVTLVRHTRPDVDSDVCYGSTDLGLADTFLRETSWQGVQKLSETFLAVDIVWYLLIVSFIGSWVICFSDWFEKEFAPIVKNLRKKIRG